jgi:hypothetical protein
MTALENVNKESSWIIYLKPVTVLSDTGRLTAHCVPHPKIYVVANIGNCVVLGRNYETV